MEQALILIGAGLLAGVMNALAGGASFVTLPALIAVGVPSVAANASSAMALYPGGLASAWVYRHDLAPVCDVPLKPLAVVSLAGGLLGGMILLWTPTAVFDQALPWLLLVATLALAIGRRLGAAMRARRRLNPGAILTVQFLLGVYGGYFGGAVGLMMMAFWSLAAGAEIKTLQAPRTLLVSVANTSAVIWFALAGVVDWRAVALLAPAGLVGGYAGAHLGRRLKPAHVQIATLALAASITALFFLRAYR